MPINPPNDIFIMTVYVQLKRFISCEILHMLSEKENDVAIPLQPKEAFKY